MQIERVILSVHSTTPTPAGPRSPERLAASQAVRRQGDLGEARGVVRQAHEAEAGTMEVEKESERSEMCLFTI